MKILNIMTVSSVALIASLALSMPSYAGKRNGGPTLSKPSPEVVLPESQGQRHKTMHAARKAAAKRMKTRLLKEHAQHGGRHTRRAVNGGVQ